ncbi:MAG: radical SAM protein [Candidatus Omnitrophica bacterium]|nr:radical SAM protein [Candidatus Omnitrophota bacterium]
MENYPSYLKPSNRSALKTKIKETYKILESCTICPRRCGVNRTKDEKGFCGVGLNPVVCSYMPHHGEEPPISGTKGSGTIFFSFCNLKCAYCQNYRFSQEGEGRIVSPERLGDMMLYLQELGCHNINLVTPTHVMPQILKALDIAIEMGLNIPLIYNSSGYELPEMIKILKGIMDIYLVDMRYADKKYRKKYSKEEDYQNFNQE